MPVRSAPRARSRFRSLRSDAPPPQADREAPVEDLLFSQHEHLGVVAAAPRLRGKRAGAQLALMTNQLPRLSATPLSLRPHPATAQEIDAVHAYTSPARAGYQLAKLITGLPDELLALIGSDPITDYAVLGCPVPDAAWPILRAIEDPRDSLDRPRRAARGHHRAGRHDGDATT
jgi:hypothetical protein